MANSSVPRHTCKKQRRLWGGGMAVLEMSVKLSSTELMEES